MKANTGKAGPENTMNGEGRGRVGIAYQVDSRHSRVKWIGPYEGGSRERERGGEQTGQSDAYLAGYSIMTICSKRGGRKEEEEIGTRFMHRLAL